MNLETRGIRGEDMQNLRLKGLAAIVAVAPAFVKHHVSNPFSENGKSSSRWSLKSCSVEVMTNYIFSKS